jgi:ABC-type lipoprotein release transport system permease subunit
MRTAQIAWRNLGRNKKRTALALLAIGVAQFALLATDGLMRGYSDNIRLAITGPMVGHVQAHHPNWRRERALDLAIDEVDGIVSTIQEDPDVADVSARIYAPVLVAPAEDAFVAMVVGLSVDSESNQYGVLSGLKAPLERGKVLIGHRLARKTNARPGQEIAVVGQAADGSLANDLYIVQDIIKCPADIINQSGIVMSLQDAQRLFVMPNQANEIVIRAKTSGKSRDITRRLSQKSLFAAIEVLPWEEIVPELVLILKMSDYVGYFALVIVFVAAIAGIANTLMMSTFERMHEFGMLLALGTRPMRIVRLIVCEAIFIGILGVAIGTVLGYGFVVGTAERGIDMASWGGEGQVEDMAYQGLNLPLHIYPRLEPVDSLVGLIAVIITSMAASVWPAWIAGRLEPMEAMRA